MNKDINNTLAALVPVLRINGEMVKSIEAVINWYMERDIDVGSGFVRYGKEVAEITYDSGQVIYADIGGDSNLTACYDVLAVIQQLKPTSSKIDLIERNVYAPPEPIAI